MTKNDMTKKDLNNSEHIDRNKKTQEDWESHHTTGDRYPEEAKGIGETDVKNAHASGDGSFGSNESRLPDEDDADKKEAKDDMPY
jgi:hypothetical protein